jgi:hypothetical protein
MLGLPVSRIGSIDRVMRNFQSFAEFLEQRDPERCVTDPSQPVPRGERIAPMTGSERDEPDIPGGRDQVAERSMFRGMFKAINPARPVSPLNSRLLATPLRKRFRPQVIGR